MDEHTQHDQNSQQENGAPARRRLGRGLNALLGGGRKQEQPQAETEANAVAAGETHVATALIDANPFQPRQEFEKESLQELADSIGQHGVLQSLLVRPAGGRFQLIAGERRLRAAQLAGLETVPCRVMELEDRAICEVAIEENLKREDLGVLEKAEAFREYLNRFDSSIEDLAKRLSMSRSAVSNYIRLLELPEPIKKAVRAQRITNGHARALLSLDDEDRIALWKRVEREGLSVRNTEKAVKEINKARNEPLISPADLMNLEDAAADAEDNEPAEAENDQVVKYEPTSLTPHLESLREQMRQMLGVKVDIQLKSREAGKIVIPFESTDEFENIMRQLRRGSAVA